MVRTAAAKIMRVGYHEYARRFRRHSGKRFLDECEQRAVFRNEASLAPILAAILRRCFGDLPPEIEQPACVENGPRREEEDGYHRRQCDAESTPARKYQ